MIAQSLERIFFALSAGAASGKCGARHSSYFRAKLMLAIGGGGAQVAGTVEVSWRYTANFDTNFRDY